MNFDLVGDTSDRAIGLRLKSFRNSALMSQEEFSLKLRFTRARLDTYESGRVPMTWPVALRICEQFSISLVWLAEGLPPRQYFVRPDIRADLLELTEARFADVYAKYLKSDLRVGWFTDAIFGSKGRYLSRIREEDRTFMHDLVENWMSRIHPTKFNQLLWSVALAGEQILEQLETPEDRTRRNVD